jgi:cytochrome c biogenesis protein CcdA
MLPAYLSYFLGLEDASPDTGTSIFRALGVAAAVSSGFVLVFLVIGLPLAGLTEQINTVTPWLTIVIGIGLVALGIAMLRGYEPVVSLPKLNKGAGSRQLSSMFLFGVSYAIASLSCTLPIFTVTLSVSFTQDGFWGRLKVFVVYALGMALVLMVLTLAIALAKQSIVQHMKRVLPYVNRIAGGLLIVAGVYLAYYGWYELRVNSGDFSTGGPARAVFDLNANLANWVQETGPGRVGLVLGAIVLAAVIMAIGLRSTRATTATAPERSRDTADRDR